MEAILEAGIQVLLDGGKERLTTTRVALRAGVSVGTLYQYFPNKGALLQAALRQHLRGVADAIEEVCREQRGERLSTMATALVSAFLRTKMKDVKSSVALYAVSSDLDAVTIVKEMGARWNKAVARMLESSCEPLAVDARLVSSVLQGAMAGVSRRLLESSSPERQMEAMRQELTVLACAYVEACRGAGDRDRR